MMNKRIILTMLAALSLIGASIFGMPMSTYAEDTPDYTATRSVTVVVEWLGIPRDEAVINLLANGEQIDSVTLTEDDNWEYTFEDLPRYGEENSDYYEITYTVNEDPIDGITTVITDAVNIGDNNIEYSVINTPSMSRSVQVSKQWSSNSVPTEVTIDLYDDNDTIVDSCVLNEDNNWTHTFEGLQYFNEENYTEIEYYAKEETPKGYTSTRIGDMHNGFTFTNTQDQIDIQVSKVWNGDGTPVPVTIYLYGDGILVGSRVLNESNAWTDTFKVNKTTSKGVDIEYTVDEEDVSGFKDTVTGDVYRGFVITNTATDTRDISVQKVWDGGIGDSVTVNLLENGEEVEEAILTEDNGWSYTFTVDKYDSNGTTINYNVTEDTVNGFTSSIAGDMDTGYTITNTKTETDDEDGEEVSTPSDADDDDDDESTPSDADESTPSDADEDDDENGTLSDDEEIIDDLPVNTPSDAEEEDTSVSDGEVSESTPSDASDGSSGSGSSSSSDDDSSGSSGSSTSSTLSNEGNVTRIEPIVPDPDETNETNMTSDAGVEGILPKTGEPMSVFTKFVMHLFYGIMNLIHVLF